LCAFSASSSIPAIQCYIDGSDISLVQLVCGVVVCCCVVYTGTDARTAVSSRRRCCPGHGVTFCLSRNICIILSKERF
jgi:hypothetical protein